MFCINKSAFCMPSSTRIPRALVLATVFSAAIADGFSATTPSDSLQYYLADGDRAYWAFDNCAALTAYRKALAIAPDNYQALWKTARAYTDVGKQAETAGNEQSFYKVADSLARRCTAIFPDSAEGHFVLALAIGRLALPAGGKTKIRLSKEIKTEAEKTLALQPRHDGAYHILGRWNYEIATLSWVLKTAAKVMYGGVPSGASLEEAAKMFAKAIEIDPNKPVHRQEYGRTLVALDRYAEARAQLQECIDLPPRQWEDPEHKKAAAALLHKIEGKP